MNNKPADTRSYATKHHSEPGKWDDIPCVRCGALALGFLCCFGRYGRW